MSEKGPSSLTALWEITAGGGMIDRDILERTVKSLDGVPLDPRSQALLRDTKRALLGEDVGDSNDFPSLSLRIGSVMKKSTIQQYLRELGLQLLHPARAVIGGSSALILQDLLSRNTEDIDLVDEVPKPIRELHQWKARAKERYGLFIAHFQSHYLPAGWADRLHSLGSFGKLETFVVDPVDIFVGKLFSNREKDLDDLRALSASLSRERIDSRLASASSLRADADLAEQARRNYYIVYGDEIPEAPSSLS